MGNEHSQLPEIDEKAVEVSDFWSHHSATIINSEYGTKLSVLIGELFVNGPLWTSQTPLEKNSKNLMIYRHPCIIKYISSWKRASKFYLALEDVKPLSQTLSYQNTLQICIGLLSILKALCFLHETASVSHNNVCVSSVYVTKDGNWKLGGMEYLSRYSNMTSDYLSKTRSTRYSKGIDCNEDKYFRGTNSRKDVVDVFAFGVLACEVLRSKTNDDIPSLTSFYELCKNILQHLDISKRPKLATLLNHDFFNHDFIKIHSFLMELPLKSDEEKAEFFHTLANRLRQFNEVFVANQLGDLLLSRMVLLNNIAQMELLPLILCPRYDSGSEEQISGLFSEDIFKKFLVPKILDIFRVRDAQIRLLLLDHFTHYIHVFSKEELQQRILPELLVGIKDTNDQLVSVTLRTLADLVPLLGAATVIGGKRAKLFNDGRPISHTGRKAKKISKRMESPPVLEALVAEVDNLVIDVLETTSHEVLNLPERPRPDGEEVETSTEEVEPSADEDLDNWEDWDINENNSSQDVTQNSLPTNVSRSTDNLVDANSINSETTMQNIDELSVHNGEIPVINSELRYTHQTVVPDINELDIKNQVNLDGATDDEFNFFQDMEPVIETSAKYVINKEDNDGIFNHVNSKLNVNVNELDNNEDGWVDEEW